MGRLLRLSKLIESNIFVFVTALAVHGLLTRGHPIVATDTGTYVALADRLTREGLAVFVSPDILISPKWMRLAYAALIAMAKGMSQVHWLQIMMVFQILGEGALGAMLVSAVRRITGSIPGAWAALILFLGAAEIFMWTPYILSDAGFAVIAFVPYRLLLDQILTGCSHWPGVTLAIVVSLLFRPPSVVLLPLVVAGGVWAWWLDEGDRWTVRQRAAMRFTWAVALMIPLLFSLTLMWRPDRWPFRVMRRPIHTLSATLHAGVVVEGRPDTYHPAVDGVWDSIAVMLDRFIRFFQFVVPDFSRLHNAYNIVYFVPLYCLVLVALISRAEPSAGGVRRRAAILFTAFWIVVFAYFHAITLLDFDWRYRLPVMPHLIVLAGCGVAEVTRRVWARFARPCGSCLNREGVHDFLESGQA